MSRLHSPQIRRDSKSIAILAIFSAMVAMLELFPIVGITDLKLVPEVPGFTIDWTGIPIIFILIGLGLVYSFFSIAIMGVAIGYRNPIGAVFKVLAESITVIGYYVGRRIIPSRVASENVRLISGLVLAAILRAFGMVIVNMALLPVFYGLPVEVALNAGIILIPWNALQAAINVLGGTFLFRMVPKDLASQAGLGEGQGPTEREIMELEEETEESSQ